MKARRAIILCFNAQPSPRQQNLYRLFQEMGWRPAYVTWDRSGVVPESLGQNNAQCPQIIRITAPTESARILLVMPKYWRAVNRVLREIRQEEDSPPIVVATHFFHLPLAWRFRNLCWLYDCAEFYAVDLSHYFGWFAPIVCPLLSFIEGMGVHRVRAVLTVDSRSGWFEKHLKRFNASVFVIPNVPALADDVARDKIKEKYSGRKVICYVGGVMERKGLKVALAAVEIVKQSVPDVLLLLVGPYSGNREEFTQNLQERGLGQHVIVTGPLSYRTMLEEIAGAEIGLALHQPGDPLFQRVGALNGRKIFTYMQAGLSIIAPAFGDIGKIVLKEECGALVDTTNPEEVANIVRALILNDGLRNKFKNNGRRAFEREYNWERVSAGLRPWLERRFTDQAVGG